MATRSKRRKRAPVPALCRHSSGQARVRIGGKMFYCGRWGTAAAQAKYSDLLKRWEEGGRQPLDPTPDCEQVRPLRELFAAWEQYLDGARRYQKRGEETSQRAIVRVAVREFCERFGNVPADRYHERLLLQHRDDLEQRERLSRSGINRKVGILRAAIKWAFGRGHLSRDQWLGTSAVDPLSRAEAGGRDRKRAKRAVGLDEIDKVAACLPRVPAAMLRLQAIIGCRPGEVCGMRWADLDRAPVDVDGVTCWTFRVEGAKAEHHGRATIYAVPPSAQRVLEQFTPTKPGGYVFAPAATMHELHDVRRAARRTPPTKQMAERDAADRREFGDRYDAPTYRQAIERAIKKAGVERFTPHEVRHGAITRACARFGSLAASSFANHSNVQTTERYLHAPDLDRYRVAVGLETPQRAAPRAMDTGAAAG